MQQPQTGETEFTLQGVTSFNHYIINDENTFVKNFFVLGQYHYNDIMECDNGKGVTDLIEALFTKYGNKEMNVMLEIDEDKEYSISSLNDKNLIDTHTYCIRNHIKLELIDPRYKILPELSKIYKSDNLDYKLSVFLNKFLYSYPEALENLYETNISTCNDIYKEWLTENFDSFLKIYEHIVEVFEKDIDRFKKLSESEIKVNFDKKIKPYLLTKSKDKFKGPLDPKFDHYYNTELSKYTDIELQKLKLNDYMNLTNPVKLKKIKEKEIKVRLLKAIRILWSDLVDFNIIFNIVNSKYTYNFLLIGEKHASNLKYIFNRYINFSSSSVNLEYNKGPYCTSLKGFDLDKL